MKSVNFKSVIEKCVYKNHKIHNHGITPVVRKYSNLISYQCRNQAGVTGATTQDPGQIGALKELTKNLFFKINLTLKPYS